MELTDAQYARIAPHRPGQRGNVRLSKLQGINAILDEGLPTGLTLTGGATGPRNTTGNKRAAATGETESDPNSAGGHTKGLKVVTKGETHLVHAGGTPTSRGIRVNSRGASGGITVDFGAGTTIGTEAKPFKRFGRGAYLFKIPSNSDPVTVTNSGKMYAKGPGINPQHQGTVSITVVTTKGSVTAAGIYASEKGDITIYQADPVKAATRKESLLAMLPKPASSLAMPARARRVLLSTSP